jgi:hypothetical protein
VIGDRGEAAGAFDRNIRACKNWGDSENGVGETEDLKREETHHWKPVARNEF